MPNSKPIQNNKANGLGLAFLRKINKDSKLLPIAYRTKAAQSE